MSFREEVRDWLEDNCPPSMRDGKGGSTGGGRRATYPNPELKVWLDRMAERGWTAPTWPAEYGGGGLDRDGNNVLNEEMRRIGANYPHSGMGLSMIGPALLEFGTDEQKQEHLPKIIRGDIWWCQGYSEPGSGSDLASLQTKAVEDGDDYVINGSKIWTSGANFADWMFCLVRTDPNASKHEGISFILFDMATPGVSVKPIKLISGMSPFCQTFLDDVRVPKKNVVGELNQGWTVGKRLLQYERTSIGGMGGSSARTGYGLAELAKRYVGPRERQDRRFDHARRRDRTPHHGHRLRPHRAPQRRGDALGQGADVPLVDVQALRHRAEQAPPRPVARHHGQPDARLGGRRIRAARAGDDAGVAAFQGQFHRGRHLGGAAQHHCETHSGVAGLGSGSGPGEGRP